MKNDPTITNPQEQIRQKDEEIVKPKEASEKHKVTECDTEGEAGPS